ncbi:ABC transporter, permease protein [Acetobacteraceae bacterium AT-5844]|nr:ABC transporter, permease protein [Acetobacteraceae bacterium AT-5844]
MDEGEKDGGRRRELSSPDGLGVRMSLALPGAAVSARGRKTPWRMPPSLLAVPLLAFLLIFYAYPLGAMLSRSVYDEGWTFGGFALLAADPTFWRVLGTTAQVAFVVTVACLLLGYPVAYAMSRVQRGTANLLMVLVLIPFWTSILVRTYAWMALLGRRGVVNNALIAMGLVDQPLQLMNTRFAVYLAMVHVLLPFMILPLYAALRGLDWRLVQAAEGLGAGPAAAFRQIVLPLSLPGMAAGCVLVFTLALGFYITPVLVGSGSDVMLSMLIGDLVNRLDWPRASAMAVVLLAMVLAVFAVLARMVPLGRVLRGGR